MRHHDVIGDKVQLIKEKFARGLILILNLSCALSITKQELGAMHRTFKVYSLRLKNGKIGHFNATFFQEYSKASTCIQLPLYNLRHGTFTYLRDSQVKIL